ncbi:hypothetical protein LCGC14_0602870 [marine sediment metagenome]|uniref:Uncharacterized protein n=1 Tax=marine sediment metagenome TaxID=412755 RepID=A0A0F9UIJ0_9ZZZZ
MIDGVVGNVVILYSREKVPQKEDQLEDLLENVLSQRRSYSAFFLFKNLSFLLSVILFSN